MTERTAWMLCYNLTASPASQLIKLGHDGQVLDKPSFSSSPKDYIDAVLPSSTPPPDGRLSILLQPIQSQMKARGEQCSATSRK